MSTVLWANYLSDNTVVSDESDKYALYKHLEKIDAICQECNLSLLSRICDSTDLQFNMDERIELPAGMKSTTELMAQQGTWIEATQAVQLLETLLSTIRSQKTRFGFLKNDHDNVVTELQESLAFAKIAAEKQAKFNFCMVM
jgi:hypothetical protein